MLVKWFIDTLSMLNELYFIYKTTHCVFHNALWDHFLHFG